MSEAVRLEIEKKIKKILAAELKVSPAILANCTSTTPLLGRGIGLDSIETMALVVGLEEEFEISVPDSDLTVALFQSVGTLTEYVFCQISEPADRQGGQSVTTADPPMRNANRRGAAH